MEPFVVLLVLLAFLGAILVGLWLLVDRGMLALEVRLGGVRLPEPSPDLARPLGAPPMPSPSLALQSRPPRLPRPLRDAPTEIVTEAPAPARVAVPGRLGDETQALIEGV